jgi:hypothetical protein
VGDDGFDDDDDNDDDGDDDSVGFLTAAHPRSALAAEVAATAVIFAWVGGEGGGVGGSSIHDI